MAKQDRSEKETEARKAEKLQAFWQDYEGLTVGQVLTAAARGDDEFRTQILEHERSNRGRAEIIGPLVNWNS